ncbi:MAG: DnaA/Hda family protein [Planctomycetota bacterium]
MCRATGCSDDLDVVGKFTEALKQRIGEDRFRMWFRHGIQFAWEPATDSEPAIIIVEVAGQFALERLQKNFASQLRGAATQAGGLNTQLNLRLGEIPKTQPVDLDFDDQSRSEESNIQSRRSDRPRRSGRSNGRKAKKPSSSINLTQTSFIDEDSVDAVPADDNDIRANGQDAQSKTATSFGQSNQTWASMTMRSFVPSACNKMAHAAATLVCNTPNAASPLFVYGPTGCGKTHILSAIADHFRREHRLRRVVHLTAETFANDFIASLRTGITGFRKRYRDADALIIDDVHFLASKKATVREFQYTLEALSKRGCPVILSGNSNPVDIPNIPEELAGRMACGLACSMQSLDENVRRSLLGRWNNERCKYPILEEDVSEIASRVTGDGRVLSGIVNTVRLLGEMYGRCPSVAEVGEMAGELLRVSNGPTTLTAIEAAVCEEFGLVREEIQSRSSTRRIQEPRMLAMFLARELTGSTFTEISSHFGVKSHSTAITAQKRVSQWIDENHVIGRGRVATDTASALKRIRTKLAAG